MEAPQREKAFNAPWPIVTVALILVGLYLLESRMGGVEAWGTRYGLVPSDLADGRWQGVLTHMGVHDGWGHVGMNAIGVLAFGAPLARKLGERLGGALAFLGFFLLCGVFAGVGHALLHMNAPVSLVGASGAVFGLIGAATRLMTPDGRLQPLFARRTLTVAGAWVGANLIIGLIGYDPGTGVRGVAWDAHILGLVAGLVLVGPWLRLFGSRDTPQPADPFEAPPPSDARSGPWGPR
ncbi:rhomboid family intramembrane serine protease [Brevundimonas sp.]|uniref:rhomboid family intramembrane serine protease n=1 Tax=Brevundimonas sp. TaxID=1871086 RepID=UPI0025EE8019|nr:rhomboid family intramembrane serine protease [Brevundimonas sp.]